MNNEIIEKLDSINWDFDTRVIADDHAVYPFNKRKFYSYPATFIPEIPFSLIEILSLPGSVVLDPFGGIGTTFIQALIQNRIPISIDNNAIASSITNDFFVLFHPAVNLSRISDSINTLLGTYSPHNDYSVYMDNQRNELKGWYDSKTYNEISYLIYIYDQIKHKKDGTSNLFHLCLTNVLTSASSQNGGWAYFADNVKPSETKLKEKKALEKFKLFLSSCVNSIQHYKSLVNADTITANSNKSIKNIINADFVSFNIDSLRENIDLIVTSPPYPKMVDYIKSQRLSFYLDEYELYDGLKQEIGARYRRNNKNTIDEYVASMSVCNKKMYDLLKFGGYLCYILPCFHEGSDRWNAIETVINNCKEVGFSQKYQKIRSIPGTQRSNNIKWASLSKEQIIIMEKQ